jgi:hypothetical protein
LLLGELRYQHDAGVEHEAHDGDLQRPEREIAVLEDSQIDDRIADIQQIGNAKDKSAGRQYEHYSDEAGTEPVVVLASVDTDLEAAEGDGDEQNAEIVEGWGGPFLLLDRRRVFDELHDAEECGNADGNVNEEDPVPALPTPYSIRYRRMETQRRPQVSFTSMRGY